MPWKIVKNDSGCPSGKPYAVRKEADNELEGCHATRADAEAQMRALYANEGTAAMRYSIEQTDTGWRVLNADGETLAEFHGTEQGAYADAVAHISTLVGRDRLDDNAPVDAPIMLPTTDDGLLPERWADVNGIAFNELLAGGRDFTECAWSWRDPPIPLMLQTKNLPAHMEAELAGFIETLTLDESSVPHASGRFYDNEAGRQARDLLLGGRQFGVSVDPSEKVSAEIVCDETDEVGWCMAERYVFTAYEIAGLTMVPFEGFENAAIRLAASNRMMFNRDTRPLAVTPDDAQNPQDDNAPDNAPDKASHDDVNYRQGEPGSQCRDCEHYIDGDTPHCEIVVDPIAPEDTCDQFESADTADDTEMPPPAENTNAASIAASISIPTSPPRGWFELPEPEPGVPFLITDRETLMGEDVLVEQRKPIYDLNHRVVSFEDEVLGMACPFEITDEGLVYGHLTYWGQCHIGNPWGPNTCASPSPSENEYDAFHASGHVRFDDGTDMRVGLLHVGCEHSEAMDVYGVRDAAAHAGLAFAQVRIVDGAYGPWMCGALLPTVTPEQVVKLRALTLSGEWVPELGAVIAVNNGGLPLQRVDKIAASNGALFPVANRTFNVKVEDGVTLKVIGGNPIMQCPECQKRAAAARAANAPTIERRLDTFEAQLDRVLITVDAIEARTRHLVSTEADAIKAALTIEVDE